MERPESESERHAVWAWWHVQVQWAEDGWDRLSAALERESGTASAAAAVVVLFVVVGVVGSTSMADLPSVARMILVVPVVLLVFVAAGWALLPWVSSTDRWRAALPVGVLATSTVASCVWLAPGLVGMVVAAALGIWELRLTGRDTQIDRLRG